MSQFEMSHERDIIRRSAELYGYNLVVESVTLYSTINKETAHQDDRIVIAFNTRDSANTFLKATHLHESTIAQKNTDNNIIFEPSEFAVFEKAINLMTTRYYVRSQESAAGNASMLDITLGTVNTATSSSHKALLEENILKQVFPNLNSDTFVKARFYESSSAQHYVYIRFNTRDAANGFSTALQRNNLSKGNGAPWPVKPHGKEANKTYELEFRGDGLKQFASLLNRIRPRAYPSQLAYEKLSTPTAASAKTIAVTTSPLTLHSPQPGTGTPNKKEEIEATETTGLTTGQNAKQSCCVLL